LEVGPVVVLEGRDDAAAIDAAFDELRRDKVGKKVGVSGLIPAILSSTRFKVAL